MPASIQDTARYLGFLSVAQDHHGYAGGYLITNPWGRPAEFRLSSAVQPNKVQQILYGGTLGAYLCSDVIGKSLVEKATTAIHVLFVDNPHTLEIRRHFDVPVGLWHAILNPDLPEPGLQVAPRLYCHPDFSEDVEGLRAYLENGQSFEFAEPFARIREALQEAKKMGVTSRAAA